MDVIGKPHEIKSVLHTLQNKECLIKKDNFHSTAIISKLFFMIFSPSHRHEHLFIVYLNGSMFFISNQVWSFLHSQVLQVEQEDGNMNVNVRLPVEFSWAAGRWKHVKAQRITKQPRHGIEFSLKELLKRIAEGTHP